MTFQQYIDMILAPKHIPLNLTPACFAISHPEEIMMVCGANAEQSLPPSTTWSLLTRTNCFNPLLLGGPKQFAHWPVAHF